MQPTDDDVVKVPLLVHFYSLRADQGNPGQQLREEVKMLARCRGAWVCPRAAARTGLLWEERGPALI